MHRSQLSSSERCFLNFRYTFSIPSRRMRRREERITRLGMVHLEEAKLGLWGISNKWSMNLIENCICSYFECFCRRYSSYRRYIRSQQNLRSYCTILLAVKLASTYQSSGLAYLCRVMSDTSFASDEYQCSGDFLLVYALPSANTCPRNTFPDRYH